MRAATAVAAAVAALALAGPAAAVDYALARNGSPAATVVIAQNASAEEKLAASEIQGYVQKISVPCCRSSRGRAPRR
jgi:hypothetical protein